MRKWGRPKREKKRHGRYALGLLCAALPAAALAQQQPPTLSAQSPIGLEGVTVTARQIEEPVHQVPFSVTAVTEQQLIDGRIRDSRDLYRTVPNFNFSDSGIPEANLLNIRGIGSSSALIGPSVTYYIDGVPVPARSFDQQFLDAKRVEILRGPQGTLFGQNSQAGAVSLVTNDPTDKPEFAIGGELGNYAYKRLSGTASGPIGDRVSGRISAQIDDRDGDIQNILFSAPNAVRSEERDIRDQTLGTINGKLRLLPGDDTTVTIAGRFQRDRQNPTTGVLLNDLHTPRNSLDPKPRNDFDSGGGSIKVEHDFGDLRLTSLTGFQGYDLGLRTDITDGFLANAQSGAPLSVLGALNSLRRIDEDLSQWSQEFRVDGGGPGRLRWVAGVSGLYSDFHSATDITSPALPNGVYAAEQQTTNLAAFGEVTVPITDRLRAIGGLRFTYEAKDFEGQFRGRAGGPPAAASFREGADLSTSFVTGRGGFGYDVTSDLSAFATVARGEKSGGLPFYNQNAAVSSASPVYRNSSTWSYELGLRGQMLDRRLELGTSVFYNDTTNEQLFTFNPVAGQFRVDNADTRSYGSEIELTARPIRGLTISGGVGLLQTEVTKVAVGSSVRTGNEVPYAPNITGNLAAQYQWDAEPVGLFGDFFARAEYQFVGSREIDPANSFRLDSYDVVNLRAGWLTERFDLYAFAQNVFDTDYVQSAFRAGASPTGQSVIGGAPGLPLTFGLGARVRF